MTDIPESERGYRSTVDPGIIAIAVLLTLLIGPIFGWE